MAGIDIGRKAEGAPKASLPGAPKAGPRVELAPLAATESPRVTTEPEAHPPPPPAPPPPAPPAASGVASTVAVPSNATPQTAGASAGPPSRQRMTPTQEQEALEAQRAIRARAAVAPPPMPPPRGRGAVPPPVGDPAAAQPPSPPPPPPAPPPPAPPAPPAAAPPPPPPSPPSPTVVDAGEPHRPAVVDNRGRRRSNLGRNLLIALAAVAALVVLGMIGRALWPTNKPVYAHVTQDWVNLVGYELGLGYVGTINGYWGPFHTDPNQLGLDCTAVERCKMFPRKLDGRDVVDVRSCMVWVPPRYQKYLK